jgi:DNA-directed RNA polymerase omega subunit
MSRITVENCLDQVANRLSLSMLALRRARELLKKPDQSLIPANRKIVVVGRRLRRPPFEQSLKILIS